MTKINPDSNSPAMFIQTNTNAAPLNGKVSEQISDSLVAHKASFVALPFFEGTKGSVASLQNWTFSS